MSFTCRFLVCRHPPSPHQVKLGSLMLVAMSLSLQHYRAWSIRLACSGSSEDHGLQTEASSSCKMEVKSDWGRVLVQAFALVPAQQTHGYDDNNSESII